MKSPLSFNEQKSIWIKYKRMIFAEFMILCTFKAYFKTGASDLSFLTIIFLFEFNSKP